MFGHYKFIVKLYFYRKEYFKNVLEVYFPILNINATISNQFLIVINGDGMVHFYSVYHSLDNYNVCARFVGRNVE